MKIGQFFQKLTCGSMILAAVACPVFTSCYDDSALNERLEQVEEDVNQIKSDLEALKNAVQTGLTVVDYNQIEGGYELLMSDGTKLYIYNGEDGQDGKDGDDGQDGKDGDDGQDGKDGDDGKDGKDGDDGKDGKDGVDGKDGKDGVDGKDGKDGDAFFQSVEAVDGYLVITLIDGTVYELPLGGNFNIFFTLSETKVVAGETYKVPYQIVGAAESDEVVVRILASSNCEAAVLPAEQAVSVTPALGAGYVDLYAINNTTGELKAKTISFNGEEFFEVSATTFNVSPLGGDVEVPVTTSTDYEIEIDGSWLAYAETKAIREETVVLTAAQANTTSYDNVATVTMKKGDKVLASFKVTQKNYYPEWIEADGKQVEWAESFKLSRYEDMSLETPSNKKGVFTIELSDDFTKGVYKVNNMFIADAYFNNSQMISNKGGVYYADVEGDVLTVYYKDAVLSYGFTNDIELTYNAAEKTFSKEKISTYNYATSRSAYIYEYTAGVKVDAPAGGGGSSLEKFVGTWTETYVNKPYSWSDETIYEGEFTVSVVDGKLYFENMFVYKMGSTTYTSNYYGTLSEDGTTITLEDANPNSPHGQFGPLAYQSDSPIVLTVEGNTLKVASAYSGQVSNYVATNPNMDLGGGEEEDPLAKFAGTWTETFTNTYMKYDPATYESCVNDAVTVSVVDGKLYFENMFKMTNYSTAYSSSYYGTLSEDGTTVTLEDAATHNGYGPLQYHGAAVLTVEGNTLKAASLYSNYVQNYVLTNPNMAGGEEPEPEPEPEPEYTLDGKQWMAEMDGMQVLFDFGIADEEMLVVGMPSMDGTGFGLYMAGLYEIVPADATSGVINFTQYDWEFDEFADPVEIPYSELTETTMKAVSEGVFGTTDPISFTLVENPYEIAPPQTGGDSPSGAIENGEYWFFNGDKVMAPLAEGVTTGTLPAGNVISGASTKKNIFTLTYDPDWTYYTIQDSYGRYLGQTDETGNITVTDVLPTDDTYAFYLWCVETGYGDACSIYNASYYYDITYSAANNNWVLVDGGYEYPETLPVLVKAENPVEEPVVPEGPKVVTAAEFNAATDNTIEYQVSGTISGIYQVYNSSYNNISIYISDETGEILAYRLSCAGITDPANTLTKGDLITVKGKRTLYNEKPQMPQGCVIVSHTDVVVETPTGGATLSFADKANRTVFNTTQQVWEQNGVKLINDKGSSTSNVADNAAPARFYKSSKITVEYAGMTKIEFACNSADYANALKSSITSGTVTISGGSVVTVELAAAADSYVINSLTGGQVRMDSLTVYTE